MISTEGIVGKDSLEDPLDTDNTSLDNFVMCARKLHADSMGGRMRRKEAKKIRDFVDSWIPIRRELVTLALGNNYILMSLRSQDNNTSEAEYWAHVGEYFSRHYGANNYLQK